MSVSPLPYSRGSRRYIPVDNQKDKIAKNRKAGMSPRNFLKLSKNMVIGMGSAIFGDLVKDKSIDGFHPGNVVTIMTSPLCGTLAPAASARTEVQGIGVQSYPIGWFTRSNFVGRFSSMLKYAGWDGIVIEGKADKPVWIDMRNEKVFIRTGGSRTSRMRARLLEQRSVACISLL